MRPVDDLQPAIGMLDHRRQAVDPVTVVGVDDAVDLAQLGVVNVAADNALCAAPARLRAYAARQGLVAWTRRLAAAHDGLKSGR